MKTTIYIPDEIKAALKRRAAAEQRSEAAIIREALAAAVRYYAASRPRALPFHPGPIIDAASHVDEELVGFGRL